MEFPTVFAAALRQLDVTPVKYEPVFGSGNSAAAARSFRLELEGGRKLKLKVMRDLGHAQQVDRLLTAATIGQLPRPIGRCGTVLLFDWIDGESLADGIPSDAVAQQAGAVLAALHSVPPPRREEWPPIEVESMLRDLSVWLAKLLAAGYLSSADAADVAALAERFAPTDFEVGFIHGDWCGENLVCDRSGQVWSIDNEEIAVGAFVYDLARVWSRWQLPAAAWRQFLAGYAAGGGKKINATDFPFWAVIATIAGAHFRLQQGRGGIAARLRRQRILVQAIHEGTVPGTALVSW